MNQNNSAQGSEMSNDIGVDQFNELKRNNECGDEVNSHILKPFNLESFEKIMNLRDNPIKFSRNDFHFYRANSISVTGVKNPFATESFEYKLTQGLIDNCKEFNGCVSTAAKTQLGIKIIFEIYSKEGKFEPISDYEASALFEKAFWLCLIHNVIKLENPERYYANKVPQFGVYCESGMYDVLGSEELINQLKKIQPLEARRQLWKVLLCADILYQSVGMPRIGYDKTAIYTNYEKDLGIEKSVLKEIYPEGKVVRNGLMYVSNLNQDYQLMNEWLHSIPIFPYMHPRAEVDIDPAMRNMLHHIGDEVAFILAAIQVGDCYILGSNDFGGHQVLAAFPCVAKLDYKKAQFNLFEEINTENFAYIYEVPRTRTYYESANSFQSTYHKREKNTSVVSVSETDNLYDTFWKNEVFQKNAGRHMKSMSMDNFLSMLLNKLKIAMHNQLEGDWFNQMIQATQLLHDKVKEQKTVTDNYNSLVIKSGLESFNHNEAIVRKIEDYENVEDYNKARTTDILNVLKVENTVENNTIVEKFLNKIKITEEIVSLRAKLLAFHDVKEDLNQTFSEISFFFKSISQKAHCDIVNPRNIENLGFFKKNSEKTHFDEASSDNEALDNATVLSISKFIYHLLNDIAWESEENYKNKSIEQYIDEKAKEHILKILVKEDTNRKLFDYWNELPDDTIIYSDLIDMKFEYRIFMINNKPAATSPCFRNTTPLNAWRKGVFDPRLSDGHSARKYFQNNVSRKIVAQYAKFARNFGKDMEQFNKKHGKENRNYVLDVAWCPSLQKVVPIEVNSVTWSGAYQINMERLVHAIVKKTYDPENSLTQRVVKAIDENLLELSHSVMEDKAQQCVEDALDEKTKKIENMTSMLNDFQNNFGVKSIVSEPAWNLQEDYYSDLLSEKLIKEIEWTNQGKQNRPKLNINGTDESVFEDFPEIKKTITISNDENSDNNNTTNTVDIDEEEEENDDIQDNDKTINMLGELDEVFKIDSRVASSVVDENLQSINCENHKEDLEELNKDRLLLEKMALSELLMNAYKSKTLGINDIRSFCDELYNELSKKIEVEDANIYLEAPVHQQDLFLNNEVFVPFIQTDMNEISDNSDIINQINVLNDKKQ